jgi:hypothetical protein
VVITGSFVATTSHTYIGAATGNITITLSSGTTNQKLIVKDEVGAATGAAPITINTVAGQTIDGQASYTIATNYGFVWLYYNNNWFVIGKD